MWLSPMQALCSTATRSRAGARRTCGAVSCRRWPADILTSVIGARLTSLTLALLLAAVQLAAEMCDAVCTSHGHSETMVTSACANMPRHHSSVDSPDRDPNDRAAVVTPVRCSHIEAPAAVTSRVPIAHHALLDDRSSSAPVDLSVAAVYARLQPILSPPAPIRTISRLRV